MRRQTNPELTLSAAARHAARRARVLTRHHHLLTSCPPAAAVVNRVAGCLGEELCRPGEGGPLLVRCWRLGARRLRAAERRPGTNDPGYLVIALQTVLAPLDAALKLRVAAPDGAIWVPEDERCWEYWRERHPGPLQITAREPVDPDAHNERLVRLERWALGPRFTHSIKATAGWPNVTATE